MKVDPSIKENTFFKVITYGYCTLLSILIYNVIFSFEYIVYYDIILISLLEIKFNTIQTVVTNDILCI